MASFYFATEAYPRAKGRQLVERPIPNYIGKAYWDSYDRMVCFQGLSLVPKSNFQLQD